MTADDQCSYALLRVLAFQTQASEAGAPETAIERLCLFASHLSSVSSEHIACEQPQAHELQASDHPQ